MSRQYGRIKRCYEYCRTITDFKPKIGLILGSGLGGYAKNMEVVCEIPYGHIPDFRFLQYKGMMGNFCLVISGMFRQW